MIPEIGHIFLILAFVSSIMQITYWAYNTKNLNLLALDILKNGVLINCLFILISFSILTYSFVVSDFSLLIVSNNSHSLKPMLYKISGTWGNHEGSLLLWVLILSSFTFWVSKKKQINNNLLFSILGVQTLILCLFLAFILFTSNPFERVETIALEGRGLNPLLQDPGLAFHPPMLYIGYVGLSVSFSFAVGALITGKINKEWAQQIRPWISISWSALTLGIALGSWWAYYELGWGGWWFWDPVENASFMPWLIATALLHSIRILEKRLIFVNWCILLSILGFSFSLLGTFIVRSGLLTSVHSFATDPSRGVFILIIMIISIGGPLILYALKSSIFKEPKVQFNLLSKESALLINNLFFTTATATVLIGTLYPLFLDALSGAKISIGPAYYNATFAPIMTPIILLMAIAPFLNWGKGKSKNLLKIIALLTLTSLIAAFSLSTINGSSIFAIICGTLSFWLFVGVISDFFVKIKETKLKITKMGSIFLYISKIGIGMNVAHLGVAIFLAGITGEQFFKTEFSERKNIGDTFYIEDKLLEFKNFQTLKGPNYQSEMATFTLYQNNKFIGYLKPEKRFYPTEQSQTTEAAILTGFWGDTYVVLGDGDNQSGWSIRAYFNPLVSWIWSGAFFMALGGLLSFFEHKNITKKNIRLT
ncbi:heme lyase CcmF/NrfE family subunit [Alphaproteobacteria bacterium]|nr:heme lyase CcmF/NrfE family subunit [Alphaproteobacteria bacterium]